MLAISQFDHFQFTFIYRPNTSISMVFTASDSAFTARHTHTGSCFRFGSAPSDPPGAISLLFSSGISGTYRPGEFIFQCHIFRLFHMVLGVLKNPMSRRETDTLLI